MMLNSRAQEGQPSVKLWNVDKELGGWEKAQRKFFDAGQVGAGLGWVTIAEAWGFEEGRCVDGMEES